MSRLQKHFQQMYGVPRQEERDLGSVVGKTYQEKQITHLCFPDGREDPILPEQYSALEAFCEQYNSTPEEMLEDKPDSISVSDDHVVGIRTPAEYRAKDNNLTIPEGFTKLQILYCYSNRLSSLTIPNTLTQLQRIYCSGNRLSSLTIPNKLTQLQTLACGRNKLSSLTIPNTLTQLKIISCRRNPLSSLIIPERVPLEELYCGHTKIPFETKQELRERGVQVIDR